MGIFKKIFSDRFSIDNDDIDSKYRIKEDDDYNPFLEKQKKADAARNNDRSRNPIIKDGSSAKDIDTLNPEKHHHDPLKPPTHTTHKSESDLFSTDITSSVSTGNTSVIKPDIKVEQPKTEPVKTEPAKVEVPKAEPVITETTKAEPPKAEPVVTAPAKVEAPKAPEVKAEAPKTEVAEPKQPAKPETSHVATPVTATKPVWEVKPGDNSAPVKKPQPRPNTNNNSNTYSAYRTNMRHNNTTPIFKDNDEELKAIQQAKAKANAQKKKGTNPIIILIVLFFMFPTMLKACLDSDSSRNNRRTTYTGYTTRTRYTVATTTKTSLSQHDLKQMVVFYASTQSSRSTLVRTIRFVYSNTEDEINEAIDECVEEGSIDFNEFALYQLRQLIADGYSEDRQRRRLELLNFTESEIEYAFSVIEAENADSELEPEDTVETVTDETDETTDSEEIMDSSETSDITEET